MKQMTIPMVLTVVLAAGAEAQPAEQIEALMRKWRIPAGAVTVLKDGETVFAQGFGVKPDALFRTASVSKPVTAAAILLLAEQGKLKLDDGMLEYLPRYRDGITDIRMRNVTIRHLLQHSGGWDERESGDPVFATFEELVANGLALPPRREDLIAGWLSLTLDFEPGTKFVYSNFGYVLLGRIVEQVTGESYAEWTAAHVLGCRGRQAGTLREERMEGEVEYFDWPGAPKGLSVFSPRPELVERPYGAFSIALQDAAAGWVLSAPEAARFLWRLSQGRIVKQEMLEEMMRRPGYAAPDSEAWYGLGVNVIVMEGGVALQHAGAFPGTVTDVAQLPGGFTYAALFNSMPADYGQFVAELQSMMLSGLLGGSE
ncbi:MAG: beta-lactamase family protein [Bryobacterales bacterium]|nr:beta-lactamase family protein [Bryobacterales bacterium]